MALKEFFPDGVTVIDDWFYDTAVPTLESLGKQYVITDHGICDDGKIYTKELQALIDEVALSGGGVIVVPEGTYRIGAVFFKQGVNLYLSKNGTLMGSDDISDYPVMLTRIEGECCKYFPALINADGVDGFTICGEGTVDGNGLRAWKSFWIRRKWNPNCTNKDEQRPRLVYLSNCSNVIFAGVRLQNSHFWTTHIYKCHHVKYIGCSIFSPRDPVKAPSTDAIDIDGCTDVLIKGCRMEVNDDSVVLKGGKGPWADKAPENGSNERIIVEDCESYNCHGGLTCGSESIHNKNVIFRRVKVHGLLNLLWLKMRPDTPQRYEYISMENVTGSVQHMVNINPWTQFYDLKDRKDIPLSYADHVRIRDCECECKIFFNVKADTSQYILSNFELENLKISTKESGFSEDKVENIVTNNVSVEIVK